MRMHHAIWICFSSLTTLPMLSHTKYVYNKKSQLNWSNKCLPYLVIDSLTNTAHILHWNCYCRCFLLSCMVDFNKVIKLKLQMPCYWRALCIYLFIKRTKQKPFYHAECTNIQMAWGKLAAECLDTRKKSTANRFRRCSFAIDNVEAKQSHAYLFNLLLFFLGG